MSKSKGSSESRLSRYVRAPIRLLCRARDLYIQSLTSCAGNMSYGGGCTDATPNSALPRSFSVTSSKSSPISNDDLRELMRAASKRVLEDKFGTESPQQQQQQRFSPSMAVAPPKGMGMPPRSRSHTVGIARIDEDKPCDFEEDKNSLNTTNFLYPRSRSCAIVTKRPGVSHY